MPDPEPTPPPLPAHPHTFAARLAAAFQLGLLALAIGLAVRHQSWPAYVLTAGLLVCLALTAWLDAQARRGRSRPAHAWLLLALLWIPANLTALLVAGLWQGLIFIPTALTIAAAPRLFDRTHSSRPMLVGVAAIFPILLLDFFLSPGFRITPEFIGWVQSLIVGAAALLAFLVLASQFNRLSLQQKLVLTFVFLAVAPAATLRSIYEASTRQALTDAARQNLSSVAAQTAGTIDAFIRGSLDLVTAQSALPPFRRLLELNPGSASYTQAAAEASAAIDELLALRSTSAAAERYLLNYALINREGIVLLDTSGDLLGRDLSTDPIYLHASVLGLPYASTVRVAEGELPARVYFSNRVDNAADQPIGVFVAAYDASFLQDLLLESRDLAGASSYGALFDENRIVLAHAAQPDLVFQSLAPIAPGIYENLAAAGRVPPEPAGMPAAGFAELDALLLNAGREPIFAVNDPAAGGTRSQVAAVQLENYPWRIAFFQPEAIFLQPLTNLTRSTLLLTGAIAAAAVLIALLASNQLAGPILQLTAAAEAVRRGDLTVEAQVAGSDEVGTLAATFNDMTRQLRETLSGLEKLVAERTARLAATNEVGRAAAAILDRNELVSRVVHLITDRFDYYYAAIFLVDSTGRWAELADATGEAGAALKAASHRLEIGGRSMVGTAIRQRSARIALDVGAEPIRFDNPLLPETRSEIALPLLAGEDVLGALDVQSTQEAAFSEQDVETLQTLASQVAIAIENANLFERTQQAARRQQAMSALSDRLQRAPDVQSILATTVTELAGLLEAEEITIRLAPESDPKTGTNGAKQ